MARTPTQRRDGKRRKAPAQSRIPEEVAGPTDDTKLFPTKNDLPEDKRVEVIGLLNQRLAEAIDLQTQCKQAHWNVKGPSFIGLHKLFDDVNEDVETYVDLIAERVVQLGGVAEGTIGAVEQRSKLPDYPIGIATGRSAFRVAATRQRRISARLHGAHRRCHGSIAAPPAPSRLDVQGPG